MLQESSTPHDRSISPQMKRDAPILTGAKETKGHFRGEDLRGVGDR